MLFISGSFLGSFYASGVNTDVYCVTTNLPFRFKRLNKVGFEVSNLQFRFKRFNEVGLEVPAVGRGGGGGRGAGERPATSRVLRRARVAPVLEGQLTATAVTVIVPFLMLKAMFDQLLVQWE